MDCEHKRVNDRSTCAPESRCFGKAGDAGVGVRRERGIVLIEILEAQRVLRRGVVIQVGHSRVGAEPAGAGNEGVVDVSADGVPGERLSLGMSHLPGSPGSAGELNKMCASGSTLAPVMECSEVSLVVGSTERVIGTAARHC